MKKECDFLCGVNNLMPDDLNVTDDPDSPEYRLMRWAYPDGHGANCHACEGIWQTELSHHAESRDAYKAQLNSNLEFIDQHRRRRRAASLDDARGRRTA